MSYNVAVIGAGPGGIVLARELARQGIKVTIYEKQRSGELGHDWSDAVELAALQAADLDMPVLNGLEWKGKLVKEKLGAGGVFEKHAVPRLDICSPGMSSIKKVDFRMITTDRQRLNQLLIEQAETAGALVRYRCEGRALLYHENGKKGPDGVEVFGAVIMDLETGVEEEIHADLIVEASGFHAVLRTGLPAYTGLADSFRDSDFALVHREVRPYFSEKRSKDNIPDHYRYGYHTGYQWTHIHNEQSIDVGSGVRNDPENPDPKDIIEEFISRHPAIKTERLRGGRSLCIVGAPLMNFVTNGFVVIGDAASTSVPTTGCGVGSAIFMALWAAEIITGAALEKRNDLEKLWAINKKFYLENDRGPSLAALAALRVMLQNLSHRELDFLFDKDLMDAATLQNAVNGVFRPPGLGKMLRSLYGGISSPPILIKLNRAITGAVRVYKHYRQYPANWDASLYEKWKSRAELLMSS